VGKPPAFKFYAADFAMDTRRMTAEQVGAYTRLLCDAWVNGSLPTDTGALSLIAGVPKRRFSASVWPALEGCWKSDGNGGYVNPRLEVERKKQREWSRKSAKGGRAGSQAKAKH
jgi:uncharacterized protein YdaU (DUF1376 family)